MKKTIRGLGIALLVLVALPFIAALFVPKEYSVERSILINRSNEEVFDYLLILRNQREFAVWGQSDPSAQYDYSGTDGTVGFVLAWESDDRNIGKGEQEITEIIPGNRINYQLRFFKPFRSSSEVSFTTEAAGSGSTRVSWRIDGRFSYPMNIFLLTFPMEKVLGDDLSDGLKNLKEILEY